LPAGIAVTGSVFENQLAASHGHFASAFRHGALSASPRSSPSALALVRADASRAPFERP
jgi:hypothetical protein